MSRCLRVGLVGAGVARSHAEAYRRLPGLYQLRAVCSLDETRGRDLCDDLGRSGEAPDFTTDFDALLRRSDLDLIDICTPPASHFALARAAVASGRDVICEKPLFASLAELDEMARLLDGSGRVLMPIFQYRFGTGLRKLRHLLALGLAGRPILTTIETHWWRGPDYYAVPWRGKWASELGGGLLGHAIHAHDMLTAVHGPVSELFAFGATLVNPIETEDTAALSLRMANGSLAALSMTLGSRREISRLRFCFHDLVAESITDPYAPARDPWRFSAEEPEHQARIDAALAEVAELPDGYERQFALFHAALADGAEPPVTLADARRSLELVTAAYHSARTGTRVRLPIAPDHPLYRGWLP